MGGAIHWHLHMLGSQTNYISCLKRSFKNAYRGTWPSRRGGGWVTASHSHLNRCFVGMQSEHGTVQLALVVTQSDNESSSSRFPHIFAAASIELASDRFLQLQERSRESEVLGGEKETEPRGEVEREEFKMPSVMQSSHRARAVIVVINLRGLDYPVWVEYLSVSILPLRAARLMMMIMKGDGRFVIYMYRNVHIYIFGIYRTDRSVAPELKPGAGPNCTPPLSFCVCQKDGSPLMQLCVEKATRSLANNAIRHPSLKCKSKCSSLSRSDMIS